MENQIFFSATMQKSPLSIPARVMVELGLDRVVYFVLRGGTDDQRERLNAMLGASLIARVPLRRARRQMLICRAYDVGDNVHLYFYESLLQRVFGDKCRIRVRICWKGELR